MELTNLLVRKPTLPQSHLQDETQELFTYNILKDNSQQDTGRSVSNMTDMNDIYTSIPLKGYTQYDELYENENELSDSTLSTSAQNDIVMTWHPVSGKLKKSRPPMITSTLSEQILK